MISILPRSPHSGSIMNIFSKLPIRIGYVEATELNIDYNIKPDGTDERFVIKGDDSVSIDHQGKHS